MAQEAIRNVASHAGAAHVTVTISTTAETFTLTVADDGHGFDPDDVRASGDEGHLGLRLLAELAVDSGACLDVESASDLGTLVRLEVPLG